MVEPSLFLFLHLWNKDELKKDSNYTTYTQKCTSECDVYMHDSHLITFYVHSSLCAFIHSKTYQDPPLPQTGHKWQHFYGTIKTALIYIWWMPLNWQPVCPSGWRHAHMCALPCSIDNGLSKPMTITGWGQEPGWKQQMPGTSPGLSRWLSGKRTRLPRVLMSYWSGLRTSTLGFIPSNGWCWISNQSWKPSGLSFLQNGTLIFDEEISCSIFKRHREFLRSWSRAQGAGGLGEPIILRAWEPAAEGTGITMDTPPKLSWMDQ